jgi:hypothetical protein
MIIELTDELDEQPIPDKWLVLRMRIARDRLLSASDHRMVSDAPWDREAWSTYRQALRDFPSTWTPSEIADFPEPPQ